MDIGSKGLAEVKLIIPQSTSLDFEIVHKDDDGNVIDHSQSVAAMAFQSVDGSSTINLDSCVTCGAESIVVTIPQSATEALPLGKMLWDLIVTMNTEDVVRIAYGSVQVVDTYALDGD